MVNPTLSQVSSSPPGPLNLDKLTTFVKEGSSLEEWQMEWWADGRDIIDWVNWPVNLYWDLEAALEKVQALAAHYKNNEWRIKNKRTGEIIMAMIL